MTPEIFAAALLRTATDKKSDEHGYAPAAERTMAETGIDPRWTTVIRACCTGASAPEMKRWAEKVTGQ
jgi:hypothetical protein